MNKGIVMEHHHNYSIIMTKDGSFQKVKVLGEKAMVGAEVYFKPFNRDKRNAALFEKGKKGNFSVNFIAMTSLALLFVLPFYFFMGKTRHNTF